MNVNMRGGWPFTKSTIRMYFDLTIPFSYSHLSHLPSNSRLSLQSTRPSYVLFWLATWHIWALVDIGLSISICAQKCIRYIGSFKINLLGKIFRLRSNLIRIIISPALETWDSKLHLWICKAVLRPLRVWSFFLPKHATQIQCVAAILLIS